MIRVPYRDYFFALEKQVPLCMRDKEFNEWLTKTYNAKFRRADLHGSIIDMYELEFETEADLLIFKLKIGV